MESRAENMNTQTTPAPQFYLTAPAACPYLPHEMERKVFTHLVGDTEYASLRAGLRMNAMANPGCDKVDFELCSLAVSAINGCGMCMDSHEKTLRKHELTVQAVQSAVRIAAVIHAAAVTLEQRA